MYYVKFYTLELDHNAFDQCRRTKCRTNMIESHSYFRKHKAYCIAVEISQYCLSHWCIINCIIIPYHITGLNCIYIGNVSSTTLLMGVLSLILSIPILLRVEHEFSELKWRKGLNHSGVGRVDGGTWPPPTARRAAARPSVGRLQARRAEMVGVALGSQSWPQSRARGRSASFFPGHASAHCGKTTPLVRHRPVLLLLPRGWTVHARVLKVIGIRPAEGLRWYERWLECGP